jgi:DNA-directed RNA polymerase subunit beta'
MLDRLKDLGFKYSTVAGITVSFADINVYSKKADVLIKHEKIEEIKTWYEDGMLTNVNVVNFVIEQWNNRS